MKVARLPASVTKLKWPDCEYVHPPTDSVTFKFLDDAIDTCDRISDWYFIAPVIHFHQEQLDLTVGYSRKTPRRYIATYLLQAPVEVVSRLAPRVRWVVFLKKASD